MKTLKMFAVCALGAMTVLSLSACKKAPAPEAPISGPTAVPTATPEPTKAPDTVDFVIAPATPEPVRAESLMKNFIISEADVDGVMLEDVDAWEGWKVIPVEYEGRMDYYAIPSETETDTEKAAGVVAVSMNENHVECVSCRVFPGKEEVDQEAVKTFYNYLVEKFPFEVVSGLTHEAWEATQKEVDMTFDHAVELANSGKDSREKVGSFVFHTAKELISLDFYMN